ncbi:MAG: flagellar basal body P-ring protein FlgI [Armatimonadota bacterium]
MKTLSVLFALLLAGATFAAELPAIPPPVSSAPAAPARISVRVKDITHVVSARDNQLLGYGIVVGLQGTGDSASFQLTAMSITNMLQRMGITVPLNKMKVKNAAAVMITATIGPFLKSGDRIDVTVNSIGDAGSLQGGTLLQTPLYGADDKVYAVAQGSISLGGFTAGGGGGSSTSGHPTVGRIPGGALVEAEIPSEIVVGGILTLSLNQPDFTTSARVAQAINAKMGEVAKARDAASVQVTVPAEYTNRMVELVAAVGALTLTPDTPARVVINERTGTVVVGGDVTVTPVAVAQGNLTVSINAALLVSQPLPLSKGGETVAEKTSIVQAEEPQVSLTQVRGSTVEELVRTLNAMKVSSRDIIAILQALKQVGALQAELQIL